MRDQLLGSRYRLVKQLGEGGMGQVWEAQDETLGRPVAVKVISLLSGGGSRGDEARARFLREAQITAQLQHPNIVTVHDLGETGTGDAKAPFLVMERVRGEGLDAKLRRDVVTLPDAARWGAQICDALADAHSAGITHRDIKPSNILITPTGTVKVLDFGIARAADPYATSDRLTQTGFIVGTPPYMAPEQARGFPEPRSDLYALGCLLFELITGQLPFQAPDTLGYLTAHLTQEPPAPSSVSAGIPSTWDDLVLSLLHKDPDQRYPNAVDVAQALRQLDHAPQPTPSTGEPTPSPTMSGTTPLRHVYGDAPRRIALAMRALLAKRTAETVTHQATLLNHLPKVALPTSPPLAVDAEKTPPQGARPVQTHARKTIARYTPVAGQVPPHPDTAPTNSQKPLARTATAVTALVCLLMVQVIPFATAQAVDIGRMTSDERMVRMTLFGVETAMLAIGVLLLFARNTAGRWLIAAGGIGLALQAAEAMLFSDGIGHALRGALPLAAVTAALSATLAVRRQRPR
ncbi:protein kinase [Streptomyces yangpuensis]|uniref:non-specific serine/threonine protein kinase n=1 Tax=Streptomyces yangpuensis TaxID=1648182 RepID=A0ABY5PR47_9ACTN|nr:MULTISPECIES: serine/threonine-protein kinase [Streptomyces]UUY45965.1 protein kinase [Streptomyces yangpuensis]